MIDLEMKNRITVFMENVIINGKLNSHMSKLQTKWNNKQLLSFIPRILQMAFFSDRVNKENNILIEPY